MYISFVFGGSGIFFGPLSPNQAGAGKFDPIGSPLGPNEPACSIDSTRGEPATERTGLHERPADASMQPSGRACAVEEQPSARGRLRRAGPCGIDFFRIASPQPSGRACAVEE